MGLHFLTLIRVHIFFGSVRRDCNIVQSHQYSKLRDLRLKTLPVVRGVARIFQGGGGGAAGVTLGQTISSWRFRHGIL